MEIHRDYPCHKANYQRGRALPVSFLVIHYVGALGGAKNNAVHYHKNRPGISAHYFVGHLSEDAAVYQSVQDSDTAWHCGRTDGKYKHPECRNANSIGIEMCCHQDGAGRWYFDPETVDQTLELAHALMEKYHIDTDHVIRHYDVTGKVCPAPYVNDPAAWAAFKKRLEENDMTEAQVREIVAGVLAEKESKAAALPVAPWADADRDWAMGEGLTDGMRPCSALTRQELWATLHRQIKEEI